MRGNVIWFFLLRMAVVVLLAGAVGCKKNIANEDDTRIKPPVRTYIVTARIDKKGTNSSSEGTAVLKGEYDEHTKSLDYSLEYKNIDPQLIAFRSGAKGSVGTLITEIYKKGDGKPVADPIKGSLVLTPLQERSLLKGQWFVVVNTLVMTPEISGVLTFKQK
ncbi:CHRD domain-containing protein [Pedobacter frigoris]|uniref:CHRD domain-containing protein n=1 Tax=Pedobacter frigoris TaxID=2571272 RepID=A0A4U1CKK1_9SPHI|nr:CHRD domain-containing protein [Pedobacter frigoris]TKC07580.1 hypothetical protein FA047_10090 [Pedobacter frigoris]